MMRRYIVSSKYDCPLKTRRKSVLNQPETGNWKVSSAYFDEEVQTYITDLFSVRNSPRSTSSNVHPTSRGIFFFSDPRIRSCGLLFLRGNSCKVVSFRQEVNGTRRRPSLPLYRSPLRETRPKFYGWIESRGWEGIHKQKNSYSA